MATMTSTRRFGEGILDAADDFAGPRANLYHVSTGQPDLDAEYRHEVGSVIEDEDRQLAAEAQAATAAPKAARKGKGKAARAEKRDGSLTVDEFDFRKHDGIVTMTNPETGDHRTFKIETLKGEWNPGKRVVSILDGPNNTSDYKRFAWIDERGIKLWFRFQLQGEGGQPGRWEKYARMIEAPAYFAERKGIQYQISGVCRRCGRALTTPESIADGIGPICAGRE